MQRSIVFIKFVHTLAFVLLTIANMIVLVSAVSGRTNTLTWVAFATVLVEGLLLMLNRWRCPLRTYAERIGAVSGQVTDIFLPKWFADRIFLICGSLLALSCLLFVIRILTDGLS